MQFIGFVDLYKRTLSISEYDFMPMVTLTKLTVRSAVIYSTLTGDIVAFNVECMVTLQMGEGA